jgi:hypothetical protein
MCRKVVIDGMSTANTIRQHMIGLPRSIDLTAANMAAAIRLSKHDFTVRPG